MLFDCDDYYLEQIDFFVVFFMYDGEMCLVYGMQWNWIDVLDLVIGVCLIECEFEFDEDEYLIDEYYIDFFYGLFYVLLDQKWIVIDGWVWYLVVVVCVWSFECWLGGNVWELESGESKYDLGGLVGEDWGWLFCFLDNDMVVFWGICLNF